MKDTFHLLLILLKGNKIKLDKEELEFQLLSHPTYPSLYSVANVLDHFKVDNIAVNVPVNERTLELLPKVFMAQVKTKKGLALATVENDGNDYHLKTSASKVEHQSREEFLQNFSGVMLAMEQDPTTAVQGSKSSFRGLWKILLIGITVLSAIGLLMLSASEPFSLLHLVLSIIGLVISTAIYKQEQGLETILGDAFCSDTSEKNDCDAVISSNGAMLFGAFKFSDMSLVYFSGLIIASFLLSLQGMTYLFPYAISLIAIPITIYSIYYQALVLNKWCLLCLTIVAVLWAQVAIAIINIDVVATFLFVTTETIITVFAFMTAITLWYFLMPEIGNSKALKENKISFTKFKKNFGLFEALLNKSEPIDTSIAGVSEMVFGQKNAPVDITIITSPFCGHCKPVHSLIEDLIKQYSEGIAITIRFNVSTDAIESDIVKITLRLLEIYIESGASICLEAMHDIYGEMTTVPWLEKWGSCEKPDQYFQILNKQSEWCLNNKLNFTPEILINGRSFPDEYDRSDLIYFIEDLNENLEEDEAVQTSYPSCAY